MSNRVKARFFKEQYFVLCPLGLKNICSVQVRLGGVLHVVFLYKRVNCLLCSDCFVYNRVNCFLCTCCFCV